MKSSLNRRFQTLLILLFLLILLQFIIVQYSIVKAQDLQHLAADIQTVMIIFLFGIFIYVVIIYKYLPFRLKRSVNRVQELVEEICSGNYQLDIESSLLGQDRDFQELILALQRMLEIMMRFDDAKSEKIFEHHQRISQLINLLPMDVLIVSISGELRYMNDRFRFRYPNLDDGSIISELFFKDDFKRRLFDHLWEAIRQGNNIYDDVIKDEATARSVLIKGSIIRNRKGNSSGAVFTMEYTDAAE